SDLTGASAARGSPLIRFTSFSNEAGSVPAETKAEWTRSDHSWPAAGFVSSESSRSRNVRAEPRSRIGGWPFAAAHECQNSEIVARLQDTPKPAGNLSSRPAQTSSDGPARITACSLKAPSSAGGGRLPHDYERAHRPRLRDGVQEGSQPAEEARHEGPARVRN